MDLRLVCLDIEEFMLTDLNSQPLGDNFLLESNLQCAYLGGLWAAWAPRVPCLDWCLCTAAWAWEPPLCLRLRPFPFCVWACALRAGEGESRRRAQGPRISGTDWTPGSGLPETLGFKSLKTLSSPGHLSLKLRLTAGRLCLGDLPE